MWLNLLAGDRGTTIVERSITSDADGYFEVGPLPRGCTYSVFMTPTGYSRHHHHIFIESDAPGRVELAPFVLKRANLKIAGRVVDEDGNPDADGDVAIYENGLSLDQVKTDNQGRFGFTKLWDSKFGIGASATGYAVHNVRTRRINSTVINVSQFITGEAILLKPQAVPRSAILEEFAC